MWISYLNRYLSLFQSAQAEHHKLCSLVVQTEMNEGFQMLIRNEAPDSVWTYYISHRQALPLKYLNPTLILILERVVNIVIYIKFRPIKVKVFQKIVRIWGLNTHLCCTTATHDGSLVAMYCLALSKYEKKCTFFLNHEY